MNLPDLRWDNPNNCCQSLRIVAELVRKGELDCQKLTGGDASATVRISVPERGRKR